MPRIAAAVDARAARLERGALRKGYRCVRARTPESGSGIVSVRHPSIDSRVIASELKKAAIIAATRSGWLRFAPHFYIRPGRDRRGAGVAVRRLRACG